MVALFGFAALIAGGLGGLGLIDTARITGGGLLLGAAAGMAAVRVGEWATRTRHVAERTVTGSLLVSAVLALLLGLFGEVALLAGPALAVAALARTREPVMT